MLRSCEDVLGHVELKNKTTPVHSPVIRPEKGHFEVGFTSQEEEKRLQFRKIQTRCYVKKFESWLGTNYSSDNRPIEDIPPSELDLYLAQFFSTVTSNHQGDYGYNSLRALRSGLERHLREKNYPHSITSSSVFSKSQIAFRRRKQMIQCNKVALSDMPLQC